MSEREDVEALAAWFHREFSTCVHPTNTRPQCEAWAEQLASAWLAAHDEAVRVSERVRLAGEVEALARVKDVLARAEQRQHSMDPRQATVYVGDVRSALVPVPGVRLAEEQ